MLVGVEDSLKVIVVGDGNVGKTSMLRRFVKGDFIEQYKKTIGAEFMEKDVFLREQNQTIKLMLWDTAGQEVFNALTQGYYRDSAAAVVAFSTVDRDSFMNVINWKQKVESVCGPITMVLCQTKFDLSNEAAVTNEEAERLAIELRMPFFRTSTKDDFNVTQLFEYTAQLSLAAATAEAQARAEAMAQRAAFAAQQAQLEPEPEHAASRGADRARATGGSPAGETGGRGASEPRSRRVNLKTVPEKKKRKKLCTLL